MSFAGAEYWDPFYKRLREADDDLDWGGRWVEPFVTPLRAAEVRTIIELGCGTGNDAARLAHQGFAVTAIDLSSEAIEQARSKFGASVSFHVRDVTQPLDFPDGAFDAAMSNVALHMFPDAVTRTVFAEIARIIRSDGLFVFHLNAVDDRPLRARKLPVVREIEANFVLEETGQTMHFFAEDYLRDLLREWRDVQLEAVEITHAETGEPYKRVWRGVARR